MLPSWTCIFGFLLGTICGSFLNVVIYRVPRRISLANPAHSFCGTCKKSLSAPDLVPVISWLVLKGRCRHCGAKIPGRYVFVELVNGLAWAGIWYQYVVAQPDIGRAVAYSAAASTLIAIIYIDWELYIIPDQINAFLFVVGWALNGWLFYLEKPEAWTWGIPSSLAGWITGVGVLWGIAFLGRVLFRKDAMGHGDIKMARGIGAILFPAVAILGFAIAVVLGAVFGILQILLRRGSGESTPNDESFEVSNDLPGSVRELILRHRGAEPADVAAASKALAEEIVAQLGSVSGKPRTELEGLKEALERKPKLWIATPEDAMDYRVSDRLCGRGEKEFDALEKALIERRWNEAKESAQSLLAMASSPSDRTAMEGVVKALDARRRFGLIPTESIGSLLKCGLGYLLCIDIVGLFFPKLYESYFGEPAFETIDEAEEYPVERTMIPFGPYLALGAIVATIFQTQLLGWVDAYLHWAAPPAAESLEQSSETGGQ